jgi:hypothetical protein
VVDHLKNHPRCDPLMGLWPVTEGPLRLGSILHCRQSRSEVPTEGTLEVIEYEPDRSAGWLVRDGPFEPIEERWVKLALPLSPRPNPSIVHRPSPVCVRRCGILR